MGIYFMFSRSKPYYVPREDIQKLDNLTVQPQSFPDAENFLIGHCLQYRGNLLVKIKYPNCTNYEGSKILLYRNMTANQLKEQKYIDPHFSDDPKYISPVARFEPTDFGWELGVNALKLLPEEKDQKKGY